MLLVLQGPDCPLQIGSSTWIWAGGLKFPPRASPRDCLSALTAWRYGVSQWVIQQAKGTPAVHCRMWLGMLLNTDCTGFWEHGCYSLRKIYARVPITGARITSDHTGKSENTVKWRNPSSASSHSVTSKTIYLFFTRYLFYLLNNFIQMERCTFFLPFFD